MHPYPSGLLNLLGAWAICTSLLMLAIVVVMVAISLMGSDKRRD